MISTMNARKPEATLTDMPWHIKQKILAKLETIDKLNLRLVSRIICAAADKSPKEYLNLCLDIKHQKVLVRLKIDRGPRLTRIFEPHPSGGYAMRNPDVKDWKKIVAGGEYRTAAVEWFMKAFESPACSVSCFALQADDKEPNFDDDKTFIFDLIEQHLDAIGFQLLAEELLINFKITQSEILQILPHFDVRKFESLHLSADLNFRIPPLTLEVDRIVETEQWKKAKFAIIDGLQCDVSIGKCSHFIAFASMITRPKDTLTEILDILLHNPNLRTYGLWCFDEFDRTGLDEYLAQFHPLPLTPTSVSITVPWQRLPYYTIAFPDECRLHVSCKVPELAPVESTPPPVEHNNVSRLRSWMVTLGSVLDFFWTYFRY